MDNIIYSYLQSLLDSDSLMGAAQATVANSSFSKNDACSTRWAMRVHIHAFYH